jgi:hypothetical protein
MIRTKSIEDQLRQGRLDAKTLDSLFRRRIEEGANCSPFVSKAILAAAKEIFPIGPDDADHQLGLGQIQLLVVSAIEPAGKPLEQCQKVTVRLTLDAGQEDFRVRVAYGVEGLRRARILRVTAEAQLRRPGVPSLQLRRSYHRPRCPGPAPPRARGPQPRTAARHRPRPDTPRAGRAPFSAGSPAQ